MPLYRKASQAETKTAAFTDRVHVRYAHVTNTHSAVTYLQLFDLAAGDVTVGTTAPTASIGLDSGVNHIELNDTFFTALTMAVTAGEANNTAPGAVAHVTFVFD